MITQAIADRTGIEEGRIRILKRGADDDAKFIVMISNMINASLAARQ